MNFTHDSSAIDVNETQVQGARANADSLLDNSGEREPELNLFANNQATGENEGERKAPENDLNSQLEKFRQQWHNELQTPQETHDDMSVVSKVEDIEEKAKSFYLQGIELEENHMLYEAIYYYKKALHLVPDIEARLAPLFSQSPRDRVRQDSESSLEGSEIEANLVTHLENLCLHDNTLCRPVYEQRASHISCLPVELLMYILRWVVSSTLDMRSLESMSQVCRGFYLCARDEQIWKMACERVWGGNVGKAKKYGGSWRRMMIERPHPHFDGCYISRMTYVRQGEQNMDQFYRPFHLVQYFRYVRFFPDGAVMMFVSPDNPQQALPKLRHKNSRVQGMMVGGYRLKDTKVTCMMKRVKFEQSNYRYKRQRRAAAAQNDSDVSFLMEFDLSTAVKRTNAKLTWSKYSSCTFDKSTGEEVMSDFQLSKTSFPPMIFSHVISFSSASEEPLA